MAGNNLISDIEANAYEPHNASNSVNQTADSGRWQQEIQNLIDWSDKIDDQQREYEDYTYHSDDSISEGLSSSRSVSEDDAAAFTEEIRSLILNAEDDNEVVIVQPSTSSSIDVIPNSETAKRALVRWVIESNTPRFHVTHLLKVLVDDFGLDFLPRDARTLLKTPRTVVTLKVIAPGHYYHFGIKRYLNMVLQHKPALLASVSELKLIVNVDGVPLAKSSANCFWSILCRISNLPLVTEPFSVGVYFGPKKPADSNLLLEMFVDELLELKNNKFFDYVPSKFCVIQTHKLNHSN